MSPRISFRRRLMAGTAIAALSLSVVACSSTGTAEPASTIDTSADPLKVTGTISLMRNSGEISDEMIASFNKIYPKIKVEAIDNDPVKLKALQAAGSPPDLFRVEGPLVPTLVSQGQLMDLTAPLADVGVSSETAYEVADLYVIDGKRYGIPNDWSPDFSVYVNNKLFEQAGIDVPDPSTPLSWKELGALGKKLTVSSGSATTQFGLGGAWDTFSPARILSTALAESGETLYSEDQENIELSSNPRAMKTLQFMADLAKDGVTHSPLNPSAAWSGDDFTKGQIAMVVYGYWFNGLLNKGDTAVGTDYTVLPAPYWESKDSRINPTITGTGYVMSSKTKSAQAAWAFMDWYAINDGAKERAIAGHGFPVLMDNAKLLPQDSAVDKQAFEVVSADAEISPALQFNRYYDDAVFTDSYNKYLQDYLKGSLDIKGLADGIEADVNAAIQDGVQQLQ